MKERKTPSHTPLSPLPLCPFAPSHPCSLFHVPGAGSNEVHQWQVLEGVLQLVADLIAAEQQQGDDQHLASQDMGGRGYWGGRGWGQDMGLQGALGWQGLERVRQQTRRLQLVGSSSQNLWSIRA